MTITSSTDAPLVVIGGITGNQGGSVLLNLDQSDKPYRLRGLTRNATSAKAKELQSRGIEMISVDLKPGNENEIEKAYEGADVVFAVTNFWEHVSKEREIAEGKAMIDSAINAKVDLFVFSALPSPARWSGGKYREIHHFEGKAEIATYGRSKISKTFNFKTVEAGFYNSNLLGKLIIRPSPTNTDDTEPKLWEWTSNVDLTTVRPLPMIDIPADYGLWVRAVIEVPEVRDPDEKRPILSSGEDVGVVEIVRGLEEATGVKIDLRTVTDEELAQGMRNSGRPEHIVDDLLQGMPFDAEFGFYGGQDVHWVDKYLARKPTTFKEWLAKTDLSEYNE